MRKRENRSADSASPNGVITPGLAELAPPSAATATLLPGGDPVVY
jgi:hypothetical protein